MGCLYVKLESCLLNLDQMFLDPHPDATESGAQAHSEFRKDVLDLWWDHGMNRALR
jgi:hypothetical protein